ncbi:MAG: hypothetical protein ACOCXH_09595 [Cyclobacteriaceae bacterium]
MKIKVDEGYDKPFLDNGRHTVKITNVEDGLSERKRIPFFVCRFENDDGFVMHRFYNTAPGFPQIIALFKSVGFNIEEGDEVDTRQLINKDVSIMVSERTYHDPDTGDEKTIKQAADFKPAHVAETSDVKKDK